ncbi:MAG: hypothetical protein AAF675_08985 [Pseudomonadota bacterium]
MALEDAADAAVIAINVAGFGAACFEVSAGRWAFDVPDVRVDARDRIEGRLVGMGWSPADGLGKVMEEGR